jgi:hypothetical protein
MIAWAVIGVALMVVFLVLFVVGAFVVTSRWFQALRWPTPSRRVRNTLQLAGVFAAVAVAGLLSLPSPRTASARAFNTEKWWEGGGAHLCVGLGPLGYCWDVEIPGIQLPTLPQMPQVPYTPQGYPKPTQ